CAAYYNFWSAFYDYFDVW
nr:immunoglobulin heavy chain junction region [Macaca mulatta]MOW76245.1 immunoglobulin heavy chain junction region [Macaca mulatta]MOW76282.1 immunoglobulin heavy chain junction region [Macaca mulatta]MOW78505.1 immunoglobulin heavy chain junction region [Macaca mulatta]MOW81559.1 immunoglobulin heavy chain junction region [Macaca mulatta]